MNPKYLQPIAPEEFRDMETGTKIYRHTDRGISEKEFRGYDESKSHKISIRCNVMELVFPAIDWGWLIEKPKPLIEFEGKAYIWGSSKRIHTHEYELRDFYSKLDKGKKYRVTIEEVAV